MDLERYFVCNRCRRYTNGVLSIGRWECSYHPGHEEYVTINGEEICRFSCCKQRVRALKYHDLGVLMGQSEHCVRRPKGCTPCDCGDDLTPVHVDDMLDYLTDIDYAQWKGFDSRTMTLHRAKEVRDGTPHA
tara:strand:+ start:6476 stop:6871 length:396 start_codon:yes stop_codon:yes gene_type:complete